MLEFAGHALFLDKIFWCEHHTQMVMKKEGEGDVGRLTQSLNTIVNLTQILCTHRIYPILKIYEQNQLWRSTPVC